MTSPSESLLESGTRLAHYQLRDHLGSGAMGTVYEAWDTSLDRAVAVKVLRPEVSEDPETVTRFVREARAAARVNHPNLGHVYFVGEEEGRRFFAMELVPGLTFEEHVAEHGRMELEAAVDTLSQAARGLAAAHAAGVIHRDVKPSNLKLLPDGSVKVLDFGLAKSLVGEVDVTDGGRILGTPRYMSPEQVRGEKLDWRTDLYCLGLMGWFLLAGKNPYTGMSLGQVLDEQMNRPLPPLEEERPELSPAVMRVLGRFCAKERDDRPATMEEAIDLLEGLRPRRLDLAPIATRGVAVLVEIPLWIAVSASIFLFLDWSLLHSESDWALGIVAFLVTPLLHMGPAVTSGRSLGQRLFGLQVVRTDGSRPGLALTAARFALRFPVVVLAPLPALVPDASRIVNLLQLVAIVAGVVCYFTRGQRTLSDIVTRTRVIHRTREVAA